MVSTKSTQSPLSLRKKRNFKNLSLQNSPIVVHPASPTCDSDTNGINGDLRYNELTEQLRDLEIGLELRLDLRAEDIETLEELGAGNGGTVCKVMHQPTKTVMAKKVKHSRKMVVFNFYQRDIAKLFLSGLKCVALDNIPSVTARFSSVDQSDNGQDTCRSVINIHSAVIRRTRWFFTAIAFRINKSFEQVFSSEIPDS
jgi:hypothetical protein